MAAIDTPGGSLLMSSDMLLDGVHFDWQSRLVGRQRQSISMIGRKSVACCLSDCAAMAVNPVAITVSLALPRDMSLDQTKELMEGMWAMADEFETQIVGGDTTRWEGRLAIDVAIVALPYDGIEPVTRSGAKPGDTLYVTGALGGSRNGGHLTFTPRVHEARKLAGTLGSRLHAMVDISDGLSLDLWRMCQSSRVGATLSQRELDSVISDAAKRAAQVDGRTALDHALNDGEDFELLLAVEAGKTSLLGELGDAPVPVYRIGEVTDEGLLLMDAEGECKPLEPKGYVH